MRYRKVFVGNKFYSLGEVVQYKVGKMVKPPLGFSECISPSFKRQKRRSGVESFSLDT